MAMKPYCSGGLEDRELLAAAGQHELHREDITPIICNEPLAPLAALGGAEATASKQLAVDCIRRVQQEYELLLVEGIGGIEVPLAPQYTIGNLIAELDTPALIVGQNRLGTLNHVLLSLHRLQALTGKQSPVALMEEPEPDLAAASNLGTLRETLPGIQVTSIQDLGLHASFEEALWDNEKKIRKSLVQLTEWVNVVLS